MVGLEGGGMCIELGVWFVRLDDNLGKLVEVWNNSLKKKHFPCR
jgi:hypothetical protein